MRELENNQVSRCGSLRGKNPEVKETLTPHSHEPGAAQTELLCVSVGGVLVMALNVEFKIQSFLDIQAMFLPAIKSYDFK